MSFSLVRAVVWKWLEANAGQVPELELRVSGGLRIYKVGLFPLLRLVIRSCL